MKPLMPPIDTPDQVFHDGDPSTGELGTICSAEWLNNVQASIRNIQAECIAILEATGFTPDGAKDGQLWEAIQAAIKSQVPEASLTTMGITRLSSSVTSDSETIAATLKAVKTAMDNANDRQSGHENLTALSSLAGSANKLPYFTNKGAMALAEFTTFMRTLLSKNDAVSVLQYLGLKETLNPTKRVSIGRTGDGYFNGSVPCINIGDSDSGFIGSTDGVIDIYCNNVRIGSFSSGGLSMLRDVSVGNMKITRDGDVFLSNIRIMRINRNAVQVFNQSGSWLSMRDQPCFSGDSVVQDSSASAIVRQEHRDRHFYIGGLGNIQFGFYMTNKSRTENGTDGQAFLSADGHFQCPSGQLIPGNYANFDARYLTPGNVYTKGESDNRYVQNIQRGAPVWPGKVDEYGPAEAPAGCFLTQARHDPTTAYGVTFVYRPLQMWVGNGWRTING
ncbi:phage tail protein [Salmonella enterica]